MNKTLLVCLLTICLGVVYVDAKVNADKEVLDTDALSILEHQDFERIRYLYRIKVNILISTLERTSKKELLRSVAENVLALNKDSLLGHLAMVKYYTFNQDDALADRHEKKLVNLINKIKGSGDGSLYTPYKVLTLVEADEFLYVAELTAKGKTLFLKGEESTANLEMLVWNDSEQLVRSLFFRPQSINILFKQLDGRVELSQTQRNFYLYSELSRLEESARIGMVSWLYKSENELAGTAYTERLIDQIRKDENLTVKILSTVVGKAKLDNARSQDEVNAQIEIMIDDLLYAREQGYTDAGGLVYALGGELSEAEIDQELLDELLEDSVRRGGPLAKNMLADQMSSQGDDDKKSVISQLYYESFRDGFSPSGISYVLFHTANPDIEPLVPVDEVLRKLADVGHQRAMVMRTISVLSKAKDGESIDEALVLLERLKKYELTLYEINELAWIYATDSRHEVRDLDQAVSMIKSTYERFDAKKFKPAFVDTMARVLAELGDYCNAVRFQKYANKLLDKEGYSDRGKAKFRKTLAGYQARLSESESSKSCGTPVFHRTDEDVVGYPEGVYRGETESGVPSGSGRFDWDDGDVYVGELASGNYTGIGKYTWASDSDWPGHQYVGHFNSGKRHGMGFYYWPNGDIYLGMHENGGQTGWGIALYSNGARYEGTFVNGMQHGEGVYHWPNGTRYVGSFDQDAFTGVGELLFTNGNRYKGQLDNGSMNGQGVFTWVDGDSYEGEFKGGTLHGKGICRFAPEVIPCVYQDGERIQGDIQ